MALGRKHNLRDRRFVLASVLPTVVLMLAVFGVPLLLSGMLSVTSADPDQGLLGSQFVGFENYHDLLTDPAFISSCITTLIYTLVVVLLEMAVGLGLALLLNLDLPGIGVFRTVMVVPMLLTPVVAAFCWRLLLDPGNGVINQWIGRNIIWLGQPMAARLAVAIVNIWQNAPYVAIVLLSGLRSLPTEPLEAARIDGATRLQSFRHVTLPLLRPYILIAVLLRSIFELRSFDNVYVLTSGGPADSTMLLSMYTYLTSFQRFDLNSGAAASWLMLAASFLLCAIFVVVIRRGATS